RTASVAAALCAACLTSAGSGSQPSCALATGSVSDSNRPTFTFTPTTGEAFASAYIRPLVPSLALPLAEGGIPIDLLLRITAQSVGGLQNGNALGGENSAGAPVANSRLQEANKKPAVITPPASSPSHRLNCADASFYSWLRLPFTRAICCFAAS
ncbi:MAG: hypothetical protein QOC89_1907, partial [Paraburkholderia sp.]|nr:hypothetical protein [Paraburkholderia sp.]